jgi:predicted dehydrogenase
MPETVGIGILGCGGRARTVARALVERFSGARVVALMDTNPEAVRESRERLNPDARVFDDPRELCTASDVDWVMVGSWNALHREHAVLALDAGKHVFCEKPLATSLDDCIAMRDAVDKSGRMFSFGLTLRYAGLYRRIRKLMDDGAIGSLVSFEFNENLEFNHGGFIHADWRRHRANAGTHLLEKCCHDIDIGNWFAGSLALRAASFGGRNFFKPENEHHRRRIGRSATGQEAYGTWSPPGANPFTDDKDIVDNQCSTEPRVRSAPT